MENNTRIEYIDGKAEEFYSANESTKVIEGFIVFYEDKECKEAFMMINLSQIRSVKTF
jgi:hypothetical protein